MIINEEVIWIVNSLVGEFEIIKDHRNSSNRTGVLEINANNKRMFIKIHNRLSRWSPEVYAYKNWTHILGEYAPRLIHSFNDDNFYGIITTPIVCGQIKLTPQGHRKLTRYPVEKKTFLSEIIETICSRRYTRGEKRVRGQRDSTALSGIWFYS